MSDMERRPAEASARTRRFPRHWTQRSQTPRLSDAALRDWIAEQIRQDQLEGRRSQRSALLDETDDYLLETRSASTTAPAIPVARSSRAGAGGNVGTVSGIGVPFLTPTKIGDAFVEQFDPAAFRKQQTDGWASVGPVAGLWMHDRTQPLASVHAKTLALSTDRTGLRYSMDLPNSSIGEHVAELVGRGDVGGASIGFISLLDDWSAGPDGMPRVTVLEAVVREQSLVWAPAYPTTTAELQRSAAPAPAPASGKLSPERARFRARYHRLLLSRDKFGAPRETSARAVRFGDRYEVVGDKTRRR